MSEKTVPVAVPMDTPTPKTLAPAEIPTSETPSSEASFHENVPVETAPVETRLPQDQPLETAPSQTELQKTVVKTEESSPQPTPGTLGGIKASAAEAGEGSQGRAVAL